MKLLLAVTWVTAALAFNSEGAILTFENFAPSGSLVNINPQFPYTEQGFTLTPLNANSAVFDSAAVAKFPGDNTDWFGFAPGNTITLTGPIPFSLDSVLIGPSTIGIGIVNFTITGNVVGGGVLPRHSTISQPPQQSLLASRTSTASCFRRPVTLVWTMWRSPPFRSPDRYRCLPPRVRYWF